MRYPAAEVLCPLAVAEKAVVTNPLEAVPSELNLCSAKLSVPSLLSATAVPSESTSTSNVCDAMVSSDAKMTDPASP